MRSLGAVALILAVITECFGAQSDRSRHRSGAFRSVPVAADIKRDADFDCPEEFGYYPHPNDCTQYYVCVFGGALLESCTGGLMYSHELQTCDWPRNVGCDASGAVVNDDLERLNEREQHSPPPPPPPRRTPPPPPPRAQPNPVVTSRGQPKFNREEYEKQQQLYAEVDDLPPVEEIESDRQQRVYRGQPSTIGQVQKDRDGYSQVSSGRTLNSNIIPASIPQNNGKIGSFSFGTQVDERRAATITQAPQRYSEDKRYNVTDTQDDRLFDVKTNEIDTSEVTQKPLKRRKRDLISTDFVLDKTNSSTEDNISDRVSNDEEMEYVEFDVDAVPTYGDERGQDESERGKRQIRYYLKNGYTPGKTWGVPKQIKLVDFRNYNYNPSAQNVRAQSNHNNYFKNNPLPESSPIPHSSLQVSTINPFQFYQSENIHGQKPFKPSLPDPTKQTLHHNPANIATQIITKSPPISALTNKENPYSSAFYDGTFNVHENNNKYSLLYNGFGNQPNHAVVFPDSSHLSSSVVTGKPVLITTSPRTQNEYKLRPIQNNAPNHKINYSENNVRDNPKVVKNGQSDGDEEYDDDDSSESSENQSSENESNENDEENASREKFKHDFPDPPYEFTHPENKFKDIENPFANPNFDFDAYLTKLSGGQYIALTSPKPINNERLTPKPIYTKEEILKDNRHNSGILSSTVNYKGMSTPRPFIGDDKINFTIKPNDNKQNFPSSTKQNVDQWPQRLHNQQGIENQEKQQSLNQNIYKIPEHTDRVPLDAVKTKLRPPNFKDDRQLPISYSFNRPIVSTAKPNYNIYNLNVSNHNYNPTRGNDDKTQEFAGTPKPYLIISGTDSPLILSTPKQHYFLKAEKVLPLEPHLVATGKPYLLSSVKPHNAYISFKQSTSKPLSTLANEHLSTLQHYWGTATPSPESYFSIQTSRKPSTESPNPKNIFSTARPPTTPTRNVNNFSNIAKDQPVSSTTKLPPKRRPIPKPSPEMNDYYYDEDEDDEQYYYEPPVKPKYMPSTEVRPQRPPMAQNYKEYDDSYEEERDKLQRQRKPMRFSTSKPDMVTKNYNDVSVVTKGSIKDVNKDINGKIPVPVMVNYATAPTTVLTRPDISNYEILHHAPRNRTIRIRKPVHSEAGPFTVKPPKYLNQTTLRPYTVRHRLAKPTTVSQHVSNNVDSPKIPGRLRHQNIVAKTIHTTPRDNHNQETRYIKTKHDDKTNSLEPTERVPPVSYSASPRPKMLYNGSQSYNPDQYDPFYAIYDEDGELYKDTDYVQQYNTASLRPAVQQTYRGTPPPQRRPVETFSPRPVSADDYDDALIQGQISNQNQYQSPIRHSTRGDVNELGYDHNPSSVKTTVYEATSISTTPTTTSTSTTTTTQRTTTAPLTEAMTPSRYTARSSTDENPIETSEPSLKQNPSDGSIESDQSTINLSSLAKPFERTDNTHRLSETLLLTEKSPTSKYSSRTNNNNNFSLDVVRRTSSEENQQVPSLTSGFSFRRNPNHSNNPYTLTVLTRPFDDYNKSRKVNNSENNQVYPSEYYHYDTNDNNKGSANIITTTENILPNTSSELLIERKDSKEELQNEEVPIYVRPKIRRPILKTRIQLNTEPTTTAASTTKYYIKTIIRRPTPFSNNNNPRIEPTESLINTQISIDAAVENPKSNLSSGQFVRSSTNIVPTESVNDQSQESEKEVAVSPYRSYDSFRSTLPNRNSYIRDSTTSTTTTQLPSSSPANLKSEKSRSKSSYYTYRVIDEDVPDQTTEVFSGKVKNVLKAFFSNLGSTPTPRLLDEFSFTTLKPTIQPEEKVVNIGFQKKTYKYTDEKPIRSNVPRLQIVTEPSVNQFIPLNDNPRYGNDDFDDGYSSTSIFTPPSSLLATEPPTTPVMLESSTNNEYRSIPNRQQYESKFNRFTTSKPDDEKSSKFHKLLIDATTERNNYDSLPDVSADQKTTKSVYVGTTKNPIEYNWDEPLFTEIASTTSTTRATSTVRTEPTSSTNSLSFPTRVSRVNPAIKLAATNPGGGRRSYQTSSNCSSDNSLQANPKCNEIKYQRPSSTRGRGSAHYSTASDAPQPITNRGTPPTRNRPTLKPSTSIVSKSTEFVDIYAYPPSRPAPVYPQPTPDKTAAKCRKDVCLLPDCYCGGKSIPGNLPVNEVPQIVLITFDDAVNDLNKIYYEEIFKKERVNPNGCPITGTFYVSHEWTDYSQVQNLYADGHEFASHTVSHSFGEQFSQKKWNREVGGQREILAAYGGVKLEDVRGMRAPFLSVGGNKMFKMLYDSNFTYDSSLPVYENRPPSWPYTLDYKLFHDCMIPPCPTKSYPGVWEVPMVMWQDLNGGRCSMGDACANPPEAEGVYKMILKNFDRHYTTNRAPFGLYYHAAWFTQPHHKEGFIMFLDFINQMSDVWIVTNWQALQWVRDPTPVSRLNNFQPFQCNYQDRPKKCNNPKVCNLWHKSGVRYMRTCQPCPEIYPWTGKTGIKSSRIDNDIGE